MKRLFTIFLAFLCYSTHAQTTSNFEGFNLQTNEFLNGSDAQGGFSDGNAFFPNDYNAAWDAWTGWSISATTDVVTQGYTNQYSSIVGSGQNGSKTYATAYAFDPIFIGLKNEAIGKTVKGFNISNSTYAYWSMKEGDAASKRFGGITGNDPDFFRLNIYGVTNGLQTTNKVVFYLADFRSADNSKDYILDTWKFVSLESLGDVDSLLFTLESSDVGTFGMNTPAYFCLDNLTTLDKSTGLFNVNQVALEVKMFPNPVLDGTVQVELPMLLSQEVAIQIFDLKGVLVFEKMLQQHKSNLDISSLSAGMYAVRLQSGIAVSNQLLLVD